MPVELHLPDLPEVPVSLGPMRGTAPRQRAPWHLRLRDTLSSYLPLLLMLLLAVFTWWLVKSTPSVPGVPEVTAPRRDPDYTMSRFTLDRFDKTGRLKVRIEGQQMRHFPDTDRIEIDTVQFRAIAPDGRVTLASARRALSNGDASEVQLMGDAQVTSVDAQGEPLQMRGEFLHVFLVTERVKSQLPVQIQRGSMVVQAGGMQYDHGLRLLDLLPPVRAVFPPRVAKAAK